jgi:Ser/Thr protein kinase RdoA (MazF antagonist)
MHPIISLMNEAPLSTTHPYDALTPDVALDALEHVGLAPDGRLLALNSYENRVYQVWLADDAETKIIVKFYRPERWSDAAILEEHAFAHELAALEIPVVAPLVLHGNTLHRHAQFRFAVFPRAAGRAPEFEQRETLEWMGRFLGRIHTCGAVSPFSNRIALNADTYGAQPLAFIEAGAFVPEALRPAYAAVTEQAMQGVRAAFTRAGDVKQIRLHGDCHAGNVLWNNGPTFVDLDDCCSGPAIQDIWMLLSGTREEQQTQLIDVLTGYEDFCEFDARELHLIEALRTLRLIHMSGWIAKRWSDPAFPRAFPWFGTERYWQDRILELREQVALMSEPALVV